MAPMNKKELMDRLTQRIYVFMYQIMEEGINLFRIIIDVLPLELELALDEMKAFSSQKK